MFIVGSIKNPLISSGNCTSNEMQMITSKEECEQTAQDLDLSSSSADEQQLEGYPHGCIITSGYLIWAPPDGHPYSNTPCGTEDYGSTVDCICYLHTGKGLVYIWLCS